MSGIVSEYKDGTTQSEMSGMAVSDLRRRPLSPRYASQPDIGWQRLFFSQL
jgi:hypothetical protein